MGFKLKDIGKAALTVANPVMGLGWMAADALGGGGGGSGAVAPAYTPRSGSISDADLNSLFMQAIGRPPSAFEAQHYKQAILSGSITPLEAQQIIQATPEAQQSRLKAQMPQLEQYLGATDENQLGKSMDMLSQRFAKQGRTTGGSAYTQAYASAAKDLALARQTQLANYFTGNFGTVNQAYAGQGAGAQNRGYQMADAETARKNSLEDYYRQKADYDNYLHQQKIQNQQEAVLNAGLGLIGTGAKAAAGMAGAPAMPATPAAVGTAGAAGYTTPAVYRQPSYGFSRPGAY